MGAAESTSRTNGTNQEEEERKQKSSTMVGAAATIAAVGVTAWMLSDKKDTQEEEERKKKSSNVVGAAAKIAAVGAGVGVAAWGISRMLSDNTDTQENEGPMKMKMIAEPSYVPEGLSQTIDAATWSPPPHGHLKLNTDGTCRPDEVYNSTYDWDGDSVDRGPSGYGGILRDHNGEWRRGFTGYIGVTDSLTAEFHGILKGLEFLDKPHYKGAFLETDSEPAYLWLIQPYKECSKSQIVKDIWVDIIEKCRRLVEKNSIKVNHVRKGANKCADKLADVAIENKVKYKEIENLPNEIYHLVYEDANKCAVKLR